MDFLLVSFDTERDTPEALHAFRKNRKLTMAHYHLYAAGLWAIAALLWLVWHARRFFKKDPQPD